MSNKKFFGILALVAAMAASPADAKPKMDFDWWFVTGDPTTNLSWIQEPYSAQSQASGGFYCSAVGPIYNYACGTAGYQITLEGNMTFDATGTCSGQYGYSGTVVPLGSVTATLTRN